MTEMLPFELPPLPPLPPPPDPTPVTPTRPVTDRDVMAGEWARELILSVSLNQPRSLQAHLGPSEIGQACERRLAYRLAATPYVNIADPTKSMIGTGFHAALAEGIKRTNVAGRYLIEHTVSYRGITGHLDLYDRYRKRVIDWKTSSVDRINRYRREGLGMNYLVQINIYAQGLIAQGEDVEEAVIIFIPREGTLSDVAAFTRKPDKAMADEYVDRYLRLQERITSGTSPAEIDAKPGPLCGWCPNFQASASDLEVACPGRFN